MPTIKFISHEGFNYEVYAETGTSLMDTAVYNGVAGIAAECGGACSCATCHVYIDPDWIAQLPDPGDAELELLEFAVDLKDNSRLSCQIEITEKLDGLVVRTPESQY
jgi:2Fe-2S ferredoxin